MSNNSVEFRSKFSPRSSLIQHFPSRGHAGQSAALGEALSAPLLRASHPALVFQLVPETYRATKTLSFKDILLFRFLDMNGVFKKKKERKVTDLFYAKAVWSLQTLNPAALLVRDQSAFPLPGFVLGAEDWRRPELLRASCPSLPGTLREQRDLQDKESNYKVLTMEIICTQIWRCVPMSEGWGRGGGWWEEPGARSRGPEPSPLSFASLSAQHSQVEVLLLQEGRPPPGLFPGSQLRPGPVSCLAPGKCCSVSVCADHGQRVC